MTSGSELLCNGRQVGVDSDEIKGRAEVEIVGRRVIKAGKQTKNLRFDNTLVIVEVSASNCAIFVQIGENRKIGEKCKLKCLTRAC